MALQPRILLRGAALCAVAFAIMLALAYGSTEARWLDASAFQGFMGLQRPKVTDLTTWLGTLGNPGQVAVISLGLIGGRARARAPADGGAGGAAGRR